MNTEATPPRPYHIVVAMDFTELSNLALEQAIALASHHPRVKLHVVTVADTHEDTVLLPGNKEPTTHAADDAKAYVLDQVSKYCGVHGPIVLPRVAVYVAVGKPATRILALAKAARADVIVMGTHGRHGMQRLLQGSVAEEVVREADCGVYVVHETTRHPPERSVPPPPPEVEVVFNGEVAE